MAYASSLGITVANRAALFTALVQFMVDRGWTKVLDRAADTNPMVVMYSTGESGTERIYLMLSIPLSGVDEIMVTAMQDWITPTATYTKGAETLKWGSYSVVKEGRAANAINQANPPTVNDDAGDLFASGSLWFTATSKWVCSDATIGAAQWYEDFGAPNNYSATSDPTTNDNNSNNWYSGSYWINVSNGKLWYCSYADWSFATWVETPTTGLSSGPSFTSLFNVGDRLFAYNSTVASFLGAMQVTAVTADSMTFNNQPYFGSYDYTTETEAVRIINSGPVNPAVYCRRLQRYNGTVIYAPAAASTKYWFFGDKNAIMVVTRRTESGWHHPCYMGLIRRLHPSSVGITQGQMTNGTNVTVTVDTTAPFEAGKNYILLGGKYCERVVVNAVNPGASTITIANLINSYPAGARIGIDPSPVMVSWQGIAEDNNNYYNFDAVWLRRAKFINGLLGASSGGITPLMSPVASMASDSNNSFPNCGVDGDTGTVDYNVRRPASPEARYGKHLLFPIFVMNSMPSVETWNEVRGELFNIFRVRWGTGYAQEQTYDVNGTTFILFNFPGDGQIHNNWFANTNDPSTMGVAIRVA